jgi:Fe-S-cluster containining protein
VALIEDLAMEARIMQSEYEGDIPHLSPDLRQEVAEGLLYTHSRLNATTTKTLEAASFLYALIELLNERGIITIEELDERKRVVGQRLVEQFRQNGNGVMFQDPEYDKYTFQSGVQIDCENRVHLCKAACCRLPFALSKQDVREGIVRWDLGQPYLIDQGKDGYCNHLDRSSLGCSIYQNRPVPCRGCDCRNDKRIWLDFEKMIVNPEINRDDWPQSLAQKENQKYAV